MTPKKPKEFIADVGREVALPARVIEDIVNYFWWEVWDNLTRLTSPKIHVVNFGDFNINHWLLDKEISKCERYKASPFRHPSQKIAASFQIQHKILLLSEMRQQVLEEKQRKEFIYTHKRITNESTDQFYPTLEE